MRFDEALIEMIDNLQPITRISGNSWCLLYNEASKEIEISSDSGIGLFKPTQEDILATDWEII